MQNYTEKGQKSNVFSQFSNFRAGRRENAKAKDIQRVLLYRNSRTNSDEAAMVLWVLLVFSSCFTAWCGFHNYYHIFSKTFTPDQATLMSWGLVAAIEVAKVFLLHRFLRSVFFGWIFQNFYELGMWLVVGILAAGSYWWSVDVSTNGMKIYTEQVAESTQEKPDLNKMIEVSTASIDAQSQTLAATLQQQNARGAYKGAYKTSDALQSLAKQRETVVNQTTVDYQNGQNTRTKDITGWAAFVKSYGGYLELVAGLCLLAIVFAECRLNQINREDVAAEEEKKQANYHNDFDPSPDPTTPPRRRESAPTDRADTAPHSPSHTHNGAPANNAAGFDLSAHSTLFNTLGKTVARSPQTVARSNGAEMSTDPDAVLQLAKTRLQSHVANFADRQRRTATTAGNCRTIINEVGHKMKGRGFVPSPTVASDFYRYIITVFEAMKANGYPYEYPNEFLEQLGQFLPAAAAAA